MDWDFTAYNEDCVIVGMKGSGKTSLANEILRGLSNVNVIVYDFHWQFSESRAVVIHNIDELFKAYDHNGGGHWIFQPHDKS